MGFLAVKARSADVAAEPRDVYDGAEAVLAAGGLEVRDVRPLDPFAKDHAMIVVRKP